MRRLEVAWRCVSDFFNSRLRCGILSGFLSSAQARSGVMRFLLSWFWIYEACGDEVERLEVVAAKSSSVRVWAERDISVAPMNLLFFSLRVFFDIRKIHPKDLDIFRDDTPSHDPTVARALDVKFSSGQFVKSEYGLAMRRWPWPVPIVIDHHRLSMTTVSTVSHSPHLGPCVSRESLRKC